jgi:hypothetical protein
MTLAAMDVGLAGMLSVCRGATLEAKKAEGFPVTTLYAIWEPLQLTGF